MVINECRHFWEICVIKHLTPTTRTKNIHPLWFVSFWRTSGKNDLFSCNLHGEEEDIINPIYGNASVEKTTYIWCDVTPPPWGLTPNIQPYVSAVIHATFSETEKRYKMKSKDLTFRKVAHNCCSSGMIKKKEKSWCYFFLNKHSRTLAWKAYRW